MTNNQKRAITRNWTKLRLMGFSLDGASLTAEETAILSQMVDLKNRLLRNWDRNSEEFLGHRLKEFKCSSCGRRSSSPYIYKEENFCWKHYSAYICNK